jgi:hypothetical protein
MEYVGTIKNSILGILTRNADSRLQDEDWKKDWQKFSEQLAEIGLMIKDVAGDGNCCFRYVKCDLLGKQD